MQLKPKIKTQKGFTTYIKKERPESYSLSGLLLLNIFVVPPRFELRQTEPKTVVLPLHHRTNYFVLSVKKRCKDSGLRPNLQIFNDIFYLAITR